MEANQEEAARAKEEGRAALRSGDFTRAVRMFTISDRLNPNPDTRALLNSARAAVARAAGPRAEQDAQTPRQPGPLSAVTDLLDRLVDGVVERLPQFIHPQFRRPLAVVGLVIIVLLIYRTFIGRPRFGALPGDIYYSSSNVYVSMPIVSCLLFSALANYLQKVFTMHGTGAS